MKKFFYSFSLVFVMHQLVAVTVSEQELLEKICNYMGKRTFLLSYPRSGNTWLRYCLEYLTGRPTFHRFNLMQRMNNPLAWSAGFEIDCGKAPIEKVHTKKEIDKSICDSDNDLLILIVRNPKEALSRHGGTEITLPILMGHESKGNADPRIYFDNIIVYDSWKTENRLLIHYEDLLTKPIEMLATVLLFLHEPLNCLDCFMKGYEFHKKKAIEIYKVSESEGNDLLFHSKLINAEYRKQIDEWIKQLHPRIWQTYLKGLYAEENINYC